MALPRDLARDVVRGEGAVARQHDELVARLEQADRHRRALAHLPACGSCVDDFQPKIEPPLAGTLYILSLKVDFYSLYCHLRVIFTLYIVI